MPVVAGLQYLTREVGIDTGITINKSKPELLYLNERKSKIFEDGIIKSFVEVKGPEFIYDIETNSGTFVSAIGNVVIHNSTIALQARNNSKFCLKIKGVLNIHKTTLFVISQTRDNIGAMGGDPTITTGGKAWKFYADVRWKIWKLNDKPNELNKTTVDVIKSKIGKPFGSAKFSIQWGVGIDTLGEIIDYAEEFNIIRRSGSWYKYGETSIGQGSNGVKATFADNPELLEEITKAVMDKLFVEKVTNDVIVPVDEKE